MPLGDEVGHKELGAFDGFREDHSPFLPGLAAFRQDYGVGAVWRALPVDFNGCGLVPGESLREFLFVVKIAGLRAEPAVRAVGHIFLDNLVFKVHHRNLLSK